MIVLRCTKKAAKALEVAPISEVQPGTSPLGDWYVNLVPTVGGGCFLFTNEQCLLAVVVPWQGTPAEIMRIFVSRVANILSMIGVTNARIEDELEHFRDFCVGKTASKRLLGVMNDQALHLQLALEDSTSENKLSRSDFELHLSKFPQATMQWSSAAEAATALLKSPTRHGAA